MPETNSAIEQFRLSCSTAKVTYGNFKLLIVQSPGSSLLMGETSCGVMVEIMVKSTARRIQEQNLRIESKFVRDGRLSLVMPRLERELRTCDELGKRLGSSQPAGDGAFSKHRFSLS